MNKGNFVIKWENSESQHLRLPGIKALLNNTDITSLERCILIHPSSFHCFSLSLRVQSTVSTSPDHS